MANEIGLTVKELRLLEAQAQTLGFTERILIENASSNLAKIIETLNLGRKVLIVAGKGNNGADVLACGRKLLNAGYDVKIAVLAEHCLNNEAEFQLSVLYQLNASVTLLNDNSQDLFNQLSQGADFILDGILGIGVNGAPTGLVSHVIEMLNHSNKKIIACDIPSGLSPNDGAILGQAVRADYTITFIAPKRGFFINQGPKHCGKILVTDIGISRAYLEKRRA